MDISKNKNDIIAIIVTIVLGIIIIFSSNFISHSGFLADKMYNSVEYYEAEVTEISEENLQEDTYIESIKLGYQQVVLKITNGPYKGQDFKVTNNVSRLYNTIVKDGSKVVASVYLEDGEISDISISSFKRSNILFVLIGLFLLVVLFIGGFKGLKSIVSLLFTLVCIIFLMIPLMLRGVSPVLSAMIIAIISITVTLVFVSGVNKKSFTAIIGTLSGVLIAGILAYVFGELANLSGINSTDAESMLYIAEVTDLKIRGIMFAGILVSALGAVMDVAMSIASPIFEISSLNKEISKKKLFKSGMNIGRDTIGTMANTLILAFAGGSLNLIILIYSSNMNTTRLLNLDVLGTEVIQGLAGTIGLTLTVPITAVIATYLCKEKDKTENNVIVETEKVTSISSRNKNKNKNKKIKNKKHK